MSDPLPAPAASNRFERIKRVHQAGAEFWSARDLARVLEYLNFRNFQPVIEKAREACAKSGYTVADHFAEMRNMVDIGSGAQRPVEDWALSRYACYLIIQTPIPASRWWRWGKVISPSRRADKKWLTTRLCRRIRNGCCCVLR